MTSRNAIVLALIAAGVVASGGSAHAAAGVPAPSLEGAVRGLVESGRDHSMRWPDLADVRATLENFYTARSWAPAWLEGGRPTTSAQVTIRQLLAASDRGIPPDDLDAAHLANVAREMLHAERAPETRELAEFEVALSADALRYFSALDRGRVSPQRAHADLLIPRPSLDGVGALERLHATDRPDTVFARAEPQFVHYQMLLYALARYRAIARDSGLVPLPKLPKNLEAGDTYRGAPQLARLLTAIGDLSDSLRVAWSGDSAYDAALAEGVRAFQRRHGQRPDGVLGRATFDRLNRPFEQRLRTIELGLERWRWLPREYDAPPIFVNVPAFRLYALKGHDDLESEMLRMNVAVGKAYRTQDAAVRRIDAIPRVQPVLGRSAVDRDQGDPSQGAARRLVPRPPELRAGERFERGHVVARQHRRDRALACAFASVPGPKNALGTVKFIFPNHHNVYLHDTPSGGHSRAAPRLQPRLHPRLEARRRWRHGCSPASRSGRPTRSPRR